MPDTIEPKWDVLGRLEYEEYNRNTSMRNTYQWNGRKLESVNLRSGKIINYTYYSDGKLKTRTVKNNAADPGVTESFSSTGWPNGTFTVTRNNTQIEQYVFSNGKLVRFSLGQRRYVVTDNVTSMVIQEEMAPSGGSSGPVGYTVKHVYIFNQFGLPIFILDGNLAVSTDHPLPRFLFWSQYYDPETGLYFLFNRFWYHPRLKRSLSGETVPFIFPEPVIDPVKEFGYISQPPLTLNYDYLNQKLYTEQGARISGLLRTINGVAFVIISVPLIASGGGAVIGVPLALWSADQIGTGISEVLTNEHFNSVGGKVIQSAAGDGTAGVLLTMAYDTAPNIATGVTSAVRGLQNTGRVSLQEASAAERAYITRSLDDVASRNTLHLSPRQHQNLRGDLLRPSATGMAPEQAQIVSRSMQRAVQAIPEEATLNLGRMGVEAAEAPAYVANRIMELRAFLRHNFPGRAGTPYTFAVWAKPPVNGRCEILIALNNPLKGIPFGEFPARGIVRPNETFVYTIARADAEATAIWHAPGNAIGGATRAGCGSCTGLMMRNQVHPVVPYRYLGVNPSIRSGNPGMFQFLRTNAGLGDDVLQTLTRKDLEALRDLYIRQYSTSGRYGGRYRVLR